jgi:hypothetical protein
LIRPQAHVRRSRAVEVKQVGRDLGVRYVLEGSVRKSGTRVRITAQLIDALTGAHLWADRFDGTLEDIFALEDRVTSGAVAQIVPKLEQVEIERAQRKTTESLDAYDYYLRGLFLSPALTREASNEAVSLFRKAIELDPSFAAPRGRLALMYVYRKAMRWMQDQVSETAEAMLYPWRLFSSLR